MELSQARGWGAPSPEMFESPFERFTRMSDEELAAFAEMQGGGGACEECGGTGYEHQPCSCPHCRGVKDNPCGNCDGSGIEPDLSHFYTREAVERLAKSDPKDLSLPGISVRRGGVRWPKACMIPDCGCIGEAHP